MSKNPLSFLRRHIAGVIILSMIAIIVMASGFLMLRNQQAQPQDLGPKLEYIGRDDLGCFLWWCEVEPYSEFYFATSMTREELAQYFTNATLKKVKREEYPLVERQREASRLSFDINDKSGGFSIRVYDNTDYALNTYRLKRTGRTSIVEILDSSYELARQAL